MRFSIYSERPLFDDGGDIAALMRPPYQHLVVIERRRAVRSRPLGSGIFAKRIIRTGSPLIVPLIAAVLSEAMSDSSRTS